MTTKLEVSNELFPDSLLDFYRGKRILVTGGTGFLGSNLIQALGHVEVRIVRLSRRGDLEPLSLRKAELMDVQGDIRERGVWEEALEKTDVVFHLAAQTSVSLADHDLATDFNVNVLPLIHLLNICRERDVCPTILFAGTVTCAGIPKTLRVDEQHPDQPLTAYDINKLSAERYLRYYAGLDAVRGASLRLSNVYGPGPNPSSPDRGILNRMIARAIQGESLQIFGEGAQIRDYIFVEDVTRAFLMVGQKGEALSGQFYMIGSGEGTPIGQAIHRIADKVSKSIGRPVPVEYTQPPESFSAIEFRNFVADSKRFRELTGWEPKVSFEDGLDRTIGAVLCKSSF